MEKRCHHDIITQVLIDITPDKWFQHLVSWWEGPEDPTSWKLSLSTSLGLRSASIIRAVTFTHTQTASSRLGEVHNAFPIMPSRPTCYVIQIAVLFQISAQGNSRFLQHIGNTIIQGEHKVFPWLQTFITRKLRGIQTYFFFFKM